MGDYVWVSKVGSDGQPIVRNVPAEQAELARQQGWSQADQAEVDNHLEHWQNRYDATHGVGAQLEAGVEGFARAIPGADWAARKINQAILGDEQEAKLNEQVLARSETTSAKVGEALGTLAAIIGTDGILGAGEAAVATGTRLLNPLTAVLSGSAKAGAAAEKLLAPVVGAGRFGRVLSGAANLGVEGAISTAAMQAGQNINEAALGDHELNAEKLLAEVPEAALFGGGFGALLGAAGGALKSAKPSISFSAEEAAASALSKDTEALGPVATESEPRSGIMDWALKKFSNAAGVVSGKAPEDIYTGLTNKSVRMDSVNLEPLKRKAVEKTVVALDDMEKLQQVEKSLSAGEFKAANLAETVRKGPDVVVNALGQMKQWDNALGLFEAPVAVAGKRAPKPVLTGLGEQIGAQNAKELRKITDDAMKRLEAAGKSANPEAETYMALEDFKRDLWKQNESAQYTIERGAGTSSALRQEKALRDITEGMHRDVRKYLEDNQQWGQAGANAAKHNAAVSEYMNTKRDFDNLVYVNTGERAPGTALRKREADATKIDSYFGQLDDWRKNKTHERVQRHLAAREKLIQTLQEIGAIPKEHAAEFAKSLEQTRELRGALNVHAERIGNAKMIRNLVQDDSSSVGTLAGSIAGHMLGGPLGAAAGFALGALNKPGQLVSRVIQIESLAQQLGRWDSKVSGAMKSFVRESSNVEKRAQPRSFAAGKVARRAVVDLGARESVDANRVYQKRSKLIDQLASNPDAMAQSVGQLTRDLERAAPATAMAVQGSYMGAVKYLQSLIARPPPSIVNQKRRDQWQPSYAETLKFNRAYRAISQPLTVVHDMQAGTLTPDAVNALRMTKPRLWESMRQTAMQTIADSGEELSYELITLLSVLFEFAGDATVAPDFIARQQLRWQDQSGMTNGSPSQSGGPPKLAEDSAKNSQTLSQKIVASL